MNQVMTHSFVKSVYLEVINKHYTPEEVDKLLEYLDTEIPNVIHQVCDNPDDDDLLKDLLRLQVFHQALLTLEETDYACRS